MTKAELVQHISFNTGLDENRVELIVESLMETVKDSMIKGNNIYLRGFGSFTLKTRAEKLGRNISKNTIVVIPAHVIPVLKFSEEFKESVSKKVKVK